jgi:electron transport complex protein RnfD
VAESKRLLILSSPPFVSEGETIERVMWRVNLVLLPALAWGVWSFGLDALRVAASCVASCVLAEAAAQRIMQRPVTVSDGSAVVTGILLAFNLPPGIPTWMTVVGSVAAIAIAKQAFGGLGFNIFNPALIGRAFLLASYPVPMTSWRPYGACDGVTCATPLGIIKEKLALPLPSYADMFLGRTGGCIGETSTLLLLAGALYLLWRRDITWHAPASFLGCLAIASRLSGRDPAFAVLAGGAVLGALFMATDMVTVPLSWKGRLIFGAGCGCITAVIRSWGGYPEGVCYAILLMNALTPVIDRYTQPRRFGGKRKSAGG